MCDNLLLTRQKKEPRGSNSTGPLHSPNLVQEGRLTQSRRCIFLFKWISNNGRRAVRRKLWRRGGEKVDTGPPCTCIVHQNVTGKFVKNIFMPHWANKSLCVVCVCVCAPDNFHRHSTWLCCRFPRNLRHGHTHTHTPLPPQRSLRWPRCILNWLFTMQVQFKLQLLTRSVGCQSSVCHHQVFLFFFIWLKVKVASPKANGQRFFPHLSNKGQLPNLFGLWMQLFKRKCFILHLITSSSASHK